MSHCCYWPLAIETTIQGKVMLWSEPTFLIGSGAVEPMLWIEAWLDQTFLGWTWPNLWTMRLDFRKKIELWLHFKIPGLNTRIMKHCFYYVSLVFCGVLRWCIYYGVFPSNMEFKPRRLGGRPIYSSWSELLKSEEKISLLKKAVWQFFPLKSHFWAELSRIPWTCFYEVSG